MKVFVIKILAISGFFLLYGKTLSAQIAGSVLPPGVTLEMVEQGGALFHGRGMCVNCHGEAAKGLIGPDLTDGEWLQAKGSYLSILQVILSGVPIETSTRNVAMPARGGAPLDDVEVQSVAAYVWSLSHQEEALPPGVSERMVARGREIFAGKGTCITCHGEGATGDVGPNLTDSEWLQAKGSYLEILNTIDRGVPQERSTRGIPMPPRGGANLSPDDVHAVGAYVWYLSHQK